MKYTLKKTTLLLSLLLPVFACSADYLTFDSVIEFQSGRYGDNKTSIISGTELNTGNNISLELINNSDHYSGTVQAICSPIVLTMMEKPGRYYLRAYFTYNSYYGKNAIDSCILGLISPPA